MANSKHVAKLREGADAWNAWRKTTEEKPDLSGVELDGDSLDGYDLSGVDFSTARIEGVTFRGARCHAISFESAYGFEATFYGADLTGATFRNATVGYSTFSECVFDESDFTDATLVASVFAAVSLRAARGLDTTQSYANSIGIDTFFASGGLPETFLRGANVPDQFIQYAASLAGKDIEYYSCFLSYSSKDDEFTRRLYNDLQGRNVRTWFAPEDLKIGDRFRSRIDESIRVHDKMVLILSASSVASDWVETEVESALERERKEGRDVLFPIAIDDEGFESQQAWARDIRRRRHIGDFRKWKSHDDYAAAFERLVRDLKKATPAIIMKGGS